MHLFLVANIVTTSKALVTRSDALAPSSVLLLLVRHLLLEVMHLFLVANIVTTSKALVTRSDALAPSSVLLLLVRHLLLEVMHLFLVANIVTTSKALVTRSDALAPSSVLLLLVRHLLLEVMHLFLVANIVTTSKALVTRSDALAPSSVLLLLVRHLLHHSWHIKTSRILKIDDRCSGKSRLKISQRIAEGCCNMRCTVMFQTSSLLPKKGPDRLCLFFSSGSSTSLEIKLGDARSTYAATLLRIYGSG